MAKKKLPAKKSTARKKASTRVIRPKGDASRLDTAPLQEHIKKRIKEIEGTASKSRSSEDTLKRLQLALDTLEDICLPSMTVPI